MYKLRDLMGHEKDGRYYDKQLTVAPRPGRDFQFQVGSNSLITFIMNIRTTSARGCYKNLKRKMTFIVYLNLDCFNECDEIIFVLKCLTITVLALLGFITCKLLFRLL